MVIIDDEITKNSLVNRDVYIQNNREKVINQITQGSPVKDLSGFYIGGGFGKSWDKQFDNCACQGELMYLFKNGSAISSGVSFSTYNKPIYLIGIKFQLH